jgi:hypothetical protein
MARYHRPVSESGKVRFIAAIEPFFSLRSTDWGGSAGFSQNRVFLGLGWRVSQRVGIEAGYVNQYSQIDDADDLVSHLALFHLRTNF